MSVPLPRLNEAQFPSLASSQTAESRYWRKYKSPIIVKEYASVSCIHFSATSPHNFAVTSSTRLQIYSSKTRAVAKTISRFKDTAFSTEFRKDGKLLVAGDASGLVQVFDASSRSILRSMDIHRLPTQVTKFSPHDLTTLLSASDDKTIRIWDMPTHEPVNTFKGHSDYVRTADFMPLSPSLIISGSYDGTIRLWDARVKEKGGEVLRLEHGASVEKVLPLPGGTGLVSAGGPVVKVWDLIAGSSAPIKVLQNHAKDVTCFASNKEGTRILSGGLDGHVKVYDPAKSWKVVHGVKYPSPILSMGLSPDDKHLVVGMTSGLLSIRTREKAVTVQQKAERSKTVSRFLRGADYKGGDEDVRVEETRRKRLRPYDKALRTYKYADALDMVTKHGVAAITTYTLLAELRHRSGLRMALINRDDIALEPILKFLIKNLSDTRFQRVIVDTSMVVLEIYGAGLGGSVLVEGLLKKMGDKLREEINRAKEASQIDGMLSLLFNRVQVS